MNRLLLRRGENFLLTSFILCGAATSAPSTLMESSTNLTYLHRRMYPDELEFLCFRVNDTNMNFQFWQNRNIRIGLLILKTFYHSTSRASPDQVLSSLTVVIEFTNGTNDIFSVTMAVAEIPLKNSREECIEKTTIYDHHDSFGYRTLKPEERLHAHESEIECTFLATKAIRRWSEYSNYRLLQRRLYCRAEMRVEVKASSRAFSMWQHFVHSKIMRRRCFKVFRRLYPQRLCSAPLPGILKECFVAWSKEFVQLMIKERRQYSMIKNMANLSRLKKFLVLWEDVWGSRLEKKYSLYRSITRIDSGTAAARFNWNRMKEKFIAASHRHKREVVQSCETRDYRYSALLHSGPLMSLTETIGGRHIRDFITHLLHRNRGICRNKFNCLCSLRRWFLCFTRAVICARKYSFNLRVDKLSSMKNHHILIASADCVTESRSLTLVKNCLSLWSKVVDSRTKKLMRCCVHLVLKPALLHWAALTDEAAVRRLRLEYVGESSFFSKSVGSTGDEIVLRRQQQQQLRSLKFKQKKKENLCKTYSDFRRCGDTFAHRSGNTSGNQYDAHGKVLEFKEAMSSSSLRDLWGNKSIDDCSRSTYLGQYRNREALRSDESKHTLQL